VVAKGESFDESAPGNGSHRRTGLDPEPIVDGTPQLLFATEVAFCGLNRNVPTGPLAPTALPRYVLTINMCTTYMLIVDVWIQTNLLARSPTAPSI
jgi:hypothetical protein